MAIFNVLAGFKTYLAASGLIGLAIHNFATGMMSQGFQSLLTAVVAAALRMAIARLEP